MQVPQLRGLGLHRGRRGGAQLLASAQVDLARRLGCVDRLRERDGDTARLELSPEPHDPVGNRITSEVGRSHLIDSADEMASAVSNR